MAVAACGGPPTTGAATGSTAASTNPARHGASQAMGLATYTTYTTYTNCIRTHGVPNFSPHPTIRAGAPKKDRQQEQQSLQQLKVSKSRLLAADKACE